MKKRISIIFVSLLLVFILIFFLSGKSIAGYYYLPSINDRIVISPPPHMENKLQPMVIKDSKEIRRFLDIVNASKNAPMGEGIEKFKGNRDNQGSVYLSIGIYSDFPDRTIGWEFLKVDNDEAYVYPTLSKEESTYIASPELIKWMEEQINKNWPEINID